MSKQLNLSLAKICALLSDGHYHDGDSLGNVLGVTRSAVWKIIKKLQDYDIEIESIKGKGYRLIEPLILLDQTEIKKHLTTQIPIDIFESIASTKDYLRNNKNAPRICLAEHQTQGKGRLGRAWHAPFGKNIYFSCLYSFQKELSELAGLSLVVSLAVLNAIKLSGLDKNIYVKWPNDILCDSKKMAGILIEVQAETNGACYGIISVGLNVNMIEDNHRISQSWTSMQKQLQKNVDRNMVCAHLINELFKYMQRFEQLGLDAFTAEWTQADYLTHKEIVVSNVDKEVRGVMQGINTQGHLLLQLPDGSERTFSSGEASIMKESW